MPSFPMSLFQQVAGYQTLMATAVAAICYVTAMISMKVWTEAPSAALVVLIILALVIGTLFEVSALRGERLGMIYVTILGLEVILIATAAILFLGEQFSIREAAGCFLVIVGAALAWS